MSRLRSEFKRGWPPVLTGLAGLFILGASSFAADPPLTVGRPPEHGGEAGAVPRYSRDVRPILSDRCFLCHGPDGNRREAKLRLDLPEEATADRGGYAAISPGDLDSSELWWRVNSDLEGERMPPSESKIAPLSEDEREILRRWILDGAPYEQHWSFVPPERPQLPEVQDADWCRSPIDRFVLAQLEARGLEPSPPAAPTAWLRRLMLDLTGLPPTLEEMDEFQVDHSSDPSQAAWTWIERILEQEPYRSRYAERMATPWLDAARYADTSGIHMDAGRQIWPWRDWVLRAFRDGMPYDQFLTEQLAGDLLPDATLDQRVASGFNRNHVTTDEGGAIDAEYLVEYAVDRTATTGEVFLGLTLGCARCHEHKFDPITQEEFYGLFAMFNSIEEPGLYSQAPDPERALEPFLEVPSAEQKRALAAQRDRVEGARAELEAPDPAEDQRRRAYLEGALADSGLAWAVAETVAASSSEGATLELQADGSVLAGGENPARDEHELVLHTRELELRLVALEVLGDASLFEARVGRASNGNAVLTGIEAVAVSRLDPERTQSVRFVWAWADHEQSNGDFSVVNALDPDDPRGWAVQGHEREGGRVALFLADRPFGFEGGTELRVRLGYRSGYARHSFGRVRLSLGRIGAAGLARLPIAASGWYVAGPFEVEERAAAYENFFGPEGATTLDPARKYGRQGLSWVHDPERRDGELEAYGDGVFALYTAKRLIAPTARELQLSLGSDDGFRLFLNGQEVVGRQVDRGVAEDQDQVVLKVPAGDNVLVFKVANTGGQSGSYYRSTPPKEVFSGAVAAAFLPPTARSPELEERLQVAWRRTHSPAYREKLERLEAVEEELRVLMAEVPRTMVMRELGDMRTTYLLERGAYDKPRTERPIERAVPAVLGALPEGAPKNRLGLAQWMTDPAHPLVARVAVNRLWQTVFGTGLVRTSGDFGLQGEWPSHPDLLDWLAVELIEKDWDLQHILRLIAGSSTYAQASRRRPELAERDPDGRLLASFPRRRLSAEAIRDQALFLSGLLVERFGGESVKPYQPEGLWKEVAMLQSNTRLFERDEGDALWRRSLYTYWKRACPPPSLMTFDAPTREACTIQRSLTNTPLQALVLWNDEQFVEAARTFAERSLAEFADDAPRLTGMFRRCTARVPEADELASLMAALNGFRARYADDVEAARALLEVGERAPDETLAPTEVAAWTLIANALFSLDETLTRE